MEVIFLRIDEQEKKKLACEAEKLGMRLTTYCRMILMQSLKKEKQ